MSDGPAPGEPSEPSLVATREDLATALTALRQAAGLSVREVAAASGVPQGTVSGWMSGHHAPIGAYRDRFDAVLRACGVTGRAEREAWWQAATRARLAPSTRGVDGRAPYQGLHAFEAADSAWYYGRDHLIDRALRELVRLSDRRLGGPPALMTVIGASGSGKSSLIRAGIIPRLRRRSLDEAESVLAGWQAVLMTPGPHPCATLDALTLNRQTVLCIDQFEEVWTQVDSETERTKFLQTLLRLAAPGQHRLVVIGLRADFYAAASRRAELHQALQECQLLVGPMTADELRDAIVEPAHRAGARVDEDLVNVLLGDLASRSVTDAHDPGGLPLLSHALLATWERSNHRRLTASDYYATGGIAGAIEQAAETTYAELGPSGQDCAPFLFFRLVNLDGETVSRRRLRLAEVLDGSDGDDDMATVVDAFCDARLLTRHVDAVEITHEALITAWPRLHGWISANRSALQLHRRLTLDARLWDNSARLDDHLLPAARLTSWREWARLEGHRVRLNQVETEYLAASEAANRRAADQAARQQRSRRRLTIMATMLAVLCMVLAVATTGAYLTANHFRDQAETARDQARSRQVALGATRLRTEDPALSSQLALAAFRIAPTLEARSALLDATAVWTPTRVTGHPGPMQVRVSPNGQLLATGDAAGTVRLFSLSAETPALVSEFVAGPTDHPDLYAMAWSDDSALLAVGGQGPPTVWDVSSPGSPRRLRTLPVSVTTYALVFVPHGHGLLAGTSDARVVGWPDASSSKQSTVVDRVGGAVSAIAVSPDGRWLAVAGAAEELALWRLDGFRATVRHVAGLTARALSVAFSPDGGEVAAGTTGNEVRRWTVTSGGRLDPAPTLVGFTSYVNGVVYRRDSHRLVAVSSDQNTAVYDLDSARRLSTMPGPAIVVSVDLTPRTVVTASTDGTVRLWPFPDPTLHDAEGPGWQLRVSADQRLLAEATGRGDGSLRLYDLATASHAEQQVRVTAPTADGVVSGTGALSADGSLLAGGTASGRVVLWRVGAGRPTRVSAVHQLPSDSQETASFIQALAISPDNRLMASVDATHADAVLWDISTARAPRREPMPLPAGAIALAVAFNSEGTLLAIGDAKDEVRLWDVSDPAHPRERARLKGFDDDVNAVAFDPATGLLAAGSADRTIGLWDVTDPDHPRLLSRISDAESPIYSVAFSSDGRRLAAGSGDGTVWLYDLNSPTAPVAIAALGAAGERVNDARFVAADAELVATGPSGALRFWRTDVSAAEHQVCARRGDPIDGREWERYLTGIPKERICP